MGRLRPGRRRGGDGRRARRLVRRHRAVPPPARAADPAHGDHPPPQGPDRAQPRRVRAGQLPHPRGDHRAARRRPRRPAARALARRAGQRRAGRGRRRRRHARHDRGARRPRRAGGHRRARRAPPAGDRGRPAARQGDRRRPSRAGTTSGSSTPCSRGWPRSSTRTGRRCASGCSRSRRGGCPSRSTTASSTRSSAACSASSPTSAPTPDHEVRAAIEARVRLLAERLRDDPVMIAKAEELKHELLSHPEVQAWLQSLWGELKRAILAAADDPRSELRRRLRRGAGAGSASGCRPTPSCRRRSTTGSSGRVAYVVEQLPRRGRRPHRHDRRALGQRRHVAAHRAAGRPRPPVHPHQRHRRRRPRRPGDPRRRRDAVLSAARARRSTCSRDGAASVGRRST